MSWWEIVIIILVAAFAIYIVLSSLIKKKNGKTSCATSCSCCPHYKECQKAMLELRKEINELGSAK